MFTIAKQEPMVKAFLNYCGGRMNVKADRPGGGRATIFEEPKQANQLPNITT
jgi:hypothetical protein